MVFGDRFSYIEIMIFCQGYVVFQDRWSVTAVVSQDRFHCNHCAHVDAAILLVKCTHVQVWDLTFLVCMENGS